jgi:cytochrome c556
MKAFSGIAAAAVLSASVIAAYAHSGATGVVMERMELMKSIQDHMKIVGEMILGKREFDAESVKTAGQTIAGHAEEIPHKFPEGSIEGPSEATHTIWEEWDTFVKLTEELKVTALAMADAAETAVDETAIRPHFAAVGKTCLACHEDFRKSN